MESLEASVKTVFSRGGMVIAPQCKSTMMRNSEIRSNFRSIEIYYRILIKIFRFNSLLQYIEI